MSVLWACVVAEQSDGPDSGGQDDRHEGAVAWRRSWLWAGTAMLLSRVPWFVDSVSLAERLAPYAPNLEASWTDEVERSGTVGDAGST